jgi:hypothetical protein
MRFMTLLILTLAIGAATLTAHTRSHTRSQLRAGISTPGRSCWWPLTAYYSESTDYMQISYDASSRTTLLEYPQTLV